LGIGPSDFDKRLHEAGLLKSTDPTRDTLKVRKSLEGKRRNVLHLAVGTIADFRDDQDRGPVANDAWVLEFNEPRTVWLGNTPWALSWTSDMGEKELQARPLEPSELGGPDGNRIHALINV
jgi:hypothetical protein